MKLSLAPVVNVDKARRNRGLDWSEGHPLAVTVGRADERIRVAARILVTAKRDERQGPGRVAPAGCRWTYETGWQAQCQRRARCSVAGTA